MEKWEYNFGWIDLIVILLVLRAPVYRGLNLGDDNFLNLKHFHADGTISQNHDAARAGQRRNPAAKKVYGHYNGGCRGAGLLRPVAGRHLDGS